MDTITAPTLRHVPPIPRHLSEAGIPWNVLVDIAVRRINIEGTSTLTSLSEALKLSTAIIADVFEYLRKNKLVEVRGMLGEDYDFHLSAAGRQMALDRMQNCQYAGPAPVALNDYHKVVRAQAAKVKVNRGVLNHALSDLVLEDALIKQLGPSLISQTSLFLYGPTGNGKTSIAERLLRVFKDVIVIPHAVEVDNQIIVLYDPVAHERVEGDFPGLDPRWVVCKRPCVIVGGEMTSPMLELRLDESSKIYAAPVQMKANNGIFIIDDFGRQAMSPRELLNRWIVPLDRRVDYLSLRYGLKFQIPFELMVVFATNLEPNDLADEAFLRRIHTKVYVETVNEERFTIIFERVARERNLEYPPEAPGMLISLCYEAGCEELRACYPADLIDIVEWIADFEERDVTMTREDLRRAVEIYFTHSSEGVVRK